MKSRIILITQTLYYKHLNYLSLTTIPNKNLNRGPSSCWTFLKELHPAPTKAKSQQL